MWDHTIHVCITLRYVVEYTTSPAAAGQDVPASPAEDATPQTAADQNVPASTAEDATPRTAGNQEVPAPTVEETQDHQEHQEE